MAGAAPAIGGGDGVELGHRALLADTAGAALASGDGTVDWWCRARFDDEPCLWGLLDREGARTRVAPAGLGPRVGPQSYDGLTFVTRTVLDAPDGRIELTDALAWDAPSPPGRLVRLATCRGSSVDVAVELRVGPGDELHTWSEGAAGRDVVVRAGIPMDVTATGLARGIVRLQDGEQLAITVDDGRASPLSPGRAAAVLDRTATAWRRVLATAEVDGPWAAMTLRTLLTLRALTWRGTGGLVGAPTTSLPEVEGGERNHDGRLVSTAEVAAWAELAAATGLAEEADDAVGWLSRVLERGVPVPTTLDLDGEPPAGVQELPWRGWRRSQPVRVGRPSPDERGPAEREQGDRDEAEAAAALLSVAAGPVGTPLAGAWPRLVEVADRLAASEEQRPTPAGRRALAAVAQLAWRRNPLDLDAAGWHAARRAAERVFSGWGPVLPGAPDPNVLRAAWLGPWPPGDPVLTRTVAEVRRHTGAGPWLAPDPPAASVVATLLEARALASLGRVEEANLTMEAVASLAGPLGLLPSAVDVLSGAARGNRPLAAAHLAFGAAALALIPDR